MPESDPHINQEQIRITKPRKEILRLLAEHTYLRTGHFYRLLSNGGHQRSRERSVRRILADFYKLGYIRRAPLVDYESGSPFLN
jgi:Fe2+ or Zn2+ uptake regulation protein